MLKSKPGRSLKVIAASVMGIALLLSAQAGAALRLGKTVSSADLWKMPSQVTFHIFDARDAQLPIVSQSFEQGEWSSTGDLAEGKTLRISAEVTALDGASNDYSLWFDTEMDGVLVGVREAAGGGVSDMYVDGEIGTGVGVRFPSGLQTAPGITSETDPNLAAHEANASAHHSRYGDSEAWAAILASDGSGSTLDADLIDGKDSAAFATSAHSHSLYVKDTGDTMTGALQIGVKSGNALQAFSPDVAGLFKDTVSIVNDKGTETIRLEGQESDGDPSSVLEMMLSDGTLVIDLDASANSIRVQNDSGVQTVSIDGDSTDQAGFIQVEDSAGLRTITIDGEESLGDAGEISMYNIDNKRTIEIDGDSGTKGGYIRLYDELGAASITLDGSVGGDGRITTQELAITGGSDLSEQFDIDATASVVEPGMLVSIDPGNPGKLVMSWEAYDRKVAGIISGAGGVKTGMMMGQEGSIANGEYPVALTGRVYAMVDTSKGAIEPGDLLTTSDVPGHAMKVMDHSKAMGAVIGKAMTPLKEGKGLVLVLVSLQ